MAATWKAAKIKAEVAKNIQVNAGTLLSKFDVTSPKEPQDADIICATTGDFSITCQPETEDWFEDVNNAPNNTKEGKRITGWTCSLSVTCLDITLGTLQLAMGAYDNTENSGGITPREQYKVGASDTDSDFKTLYWIGDMVDETKVFVVKLGDTINTAGISFTSTKNGKGQLSLELTPHTSLATPTKVPMEFYILEKQAAE